ncbi:period circadian protein homolog 2-like [Mixophyes fleayi]|uniref:period circadian protein homolog 2-like n=1 Tax=Mixophyes fleayi TaxID=3061075 RepID=UPI003F4DC9D1
MSRRALRDLTTSVQLQSSEFSPSQHNVSTGLLNASPHFKQDEHFPPGCSNSHVSLSQNAMAGLQGSSSMVQPLSVETVRMLPSKPGDPSTDGHLVGHGTCVKDKSCGSFHIGDIISQRHYTTLENLLTNGSPRAHQAEAMQSHHSTEDLGDPITHLQDDMETNDSSSNELNESDESGKDLASKSSSERRQPSCSSNAFSLMMADSEQNPSTSGYSSEQPAKAKTQKELLKILKEIRFCLPREKRFRGKSGTAASLRYALQCMQQVKANEEYYQLPMVNDKHPCSQNLPSYTVQEIATITSEFTKNNTDVFAVTVSLVTGRILYISEQASVVLRCSAELFSHVRFVELLAPQDVSVFYSSTTPYRLPSWNICNGTDSGYLDGVEEKSFYCRISCGHESQREVSYHPFRLTPYLISVQTEGSTTEQLSCVLFAERVHSGYEAPRIPADKRIFTTTHTPSCLFQDVDERAVPLLGYLPQDLIGSHIFLHLHPNDRSLMLAVHKKILQHGGQPFDFSPIRFCARNGEYITIDTSWSSFINPWSRKVSFIIGRHKVRMGPVNEDIFTAPPHIEDRSLQPGIQELSEQIHQLLMQPVHNSSSSGYGSLGSNGSHENPMSGASSSDSNGNLNEDMKEKQGTPPPVHGLKGELGSTHLEIKDPQEIIHEADISCEGSGTAACSPRCEPLPAKRPYSYQQINCLDNVIRYLESCSVLASDKCKFDSCKKTASLAFKNDRAQVQEQGDKQERQMGFATGATDKPFSGGLSFPPISGPATTCLPVSGSLPHPSLTSMPVSGAAITQLSMVAKAESVASLTSHCSYSSTIVHVGDKKLQPETELEDGVSHSVDIPPLPPGNTDKEPYKQLGLTKKMLVAHTHREENDFLKGFMDVKRLSAFQTRCNSYMHERPGALRSHGPQGADAGIRRSGKARKPKVKRVRPESWDSSSSGIPQAHRCPLSGLNTTAWSQSDNSHASYPPLPYPVLPAYPLPVFPPPQIPMPNDTLHGHTSNMQPFHTPLLSPMVALVLPNYMYPPSLPTTVYPGPAPQHPFPVQPSLYTPQPTFTPSNPTFSVPQPPFPIPQPVSPQSMQSPCTVQPFSYPVHQSELKLKEGLSRSSTPQDPQSPPLFQSRCSSPLQLNLLQLEESLKADRSEGGTGVGVAVNTTSMPQPCEDPDLAGSPEDDHTSDAVSTGSDLMDLLLQEDASSGTCSISSAVSESLTSGFCGNGTSGSQTGSSQTSHSSKYFGSVDSSENNQKERGLTPASGVAVMKYVLQDPMWLLTANADENVMMTYQILQKDMDVVLREDRDRLKSVQKFQPRFTDDQWKELGEIHSWITRRGLPGAVEGTSCIFCKERGSDCAEYADTIQELELSGIMESFD